MSIEKNKEIAKQYFSAINAHDWELVESLIHDEFGLQPLPTQNYIKELTQGGVNPFIEFFKLLGYDDKITEEVKKRVLRVKDKQSQINYIQWMSQYSSNHKIQDMVADGNQVWFYGTSDILSNTQHKINHSGYTQVILKDFKIIDDHNVGRYLGSLMQIGKIIMTNNDKEEIEKYLQGLRNLGIIPEKP